MLQDYIVDTRDLIRDTQGLFVTPFQLNRFVNEARTQVALQTGCVQCLVTGTPLFGTSAQPGQAVPGGAMAGANPQSTFQTIPGQERYPFIGFANDYLTKQFTGTDSILDVVSVSVSWGGAFRPSLRWLPMEEMESCLRSTQTFVTSYPYLWSVLSDGGNGALIVYPPPMTANEMEWLVFALPAPLYTDNDVDVIPHPFRRAVKYYAAKRAYEASQRFMNAQLMEQQFNMSLVGSRGSVDRGKANYYTTSL